MVPGGLLPTIPVPKDFAEHDAANDPAAAIPPVPQGLRNGFMASRRNWQPRGLDYLALVPRCGTHGDSATVTRRPIGSGG